jgi:hypothetical protein
MTSHILDLIDHYRITLQNREHIAEDFGSVVGETERWMAFVHNDPTRKTGFGKTAADAAKEYLDNRFPDGIPDPGKPLATE